MPVVASNPGGRAVHVRLQGHPPNWIGATRRAGTSAMSLSRRAAAQRAVARPATRATVHFATGREVLDGLVGEARARALSRRAQVCSGAPPEPQTRMYAADRE